MRGRLIFFSALCSMPSLLERMPPALRGDQDQSRRRARDSIIAVHTEVVSAAADWVLSHGPTAPNGSSYKDLFIPNLRAFIDQKKAELEDMRTKAFSAADGLTPAQTISLGRICRRAWWVA